MTLPMNLFADAPEMQDVSMTQLGEDVQAWPEELVQKFKERIPDAQSMSIISKFVKMDEETGTATGSLEISNATTKATVPLIIKEFSLYPMDVFIANNKILPLTPDFFAQIFNQQADPFKRLEEYPNYGGMGRFDDGNLWNAVYPPSLGRYAYASAGYPILDTISETINPKEMWDFLKANPAIAANFQKHGQTEIVEKIANLQPVNMNEYGQGKQNLLNRNIAMLRKDGPNKYTILANSDEVFSPIVKQVPKGQIPQTCSDMRLTVSDHVQDDINDVDQNGEKFLSLPVRSTIADNGGPYIEEGENRRIEQATECDHYVVRKPNGVEVEGVVIPDVTDFNNVPTDQKLFLGKTYSSMQANIAGVRVQNSSFVPKTSEPKPGQTGTFVCMCNKSKMQATIPVTIESVHISYVGNTDIVATDLTGMPIRIDYTESDFKKIVPPSAPSSTTPSCGEDNSYRVSSKHYKWVPMEGFGELTAHALDFAVKTAGMKKTANPAKIISTGYGLYSVKGLDKYAYAAEMNPQLMTQNNVGFLLVSLGFPQEKLASVYKTASKYGQATIHGLNSPILESEKVASRNNSMQKVASFAAKLKSNLIKEASFMEDSQSVDALLSLNFINPDNISKFVGKLPSLKGAISSLASLLIASRLGVKEVPEQAVSTAMMRLVEVVNGLETLRATQQQSQ